MSPCRAWVPTHPPETAAPTAHAGELPSSDVIQAGRRRVSSCNKPNLSSFGWDRWLRPPTLVGGAPQGGGRAAMLLGMRALRADPGDPSCAWPRCCPPPRVWGRRIPRPVGPWGAAGRSSGAEPCGAGAPAAGTAHGDMSNGVAEAGVTSSGGVRGKRLMLSSCPLSFP